LSETIPHSLISLLGAKPIALHLTLHHIERITRDPQRLASKATIQRNLGRGHLLPLDAVPPRVGIHEVLEGEKPHAVGLGLAQHGDRLAAIQAAEDALVRADLADAVERAGIQPRRAVRLRLQPDAHVLDRPRDHRVCDARECPCEIVLAVAERRVALRRRVALLEPPPRVVEAAELHRDAGADAEERCQRAFVEGQRPFVLPDVCCAVERAFVLLCGLQPDFDDVEWLA